MLYALWRLSCAVVMLGFIGSIGCSMNVIDQMGSFKGVNTEQLRDWIREDPERHQLIVFVHGFNSSKDTAWGEFPALLKDDPDFVDFNIHRFGYPTKICAQVSDIRNEGQYWHLTLATCSPVHVPSLAEWCSSVTVWEV